VSRILIIGGSQGIGRSLVDLLLASEHQLMVVARESRDLPLDKLHFQPHDAKASQWPDIPWETLEGMVYLPGSINLKPFHRLAIADFQQDFDINVLGAIRALQHYLLALKGAEQASVVLASTVAVARGMSYHTSVAASKGAIEGVTRSLAAELAPKIRVNAVAPSLVDTPLASRLLANDERKLASAQRHPLKRVGLPNDIAQAIAFLLEPTSSWISGQILAVDGGLANIHAT